MSAPAGLKNPGAAVRGVGDGSVAILITGSVVTVADARGLLKR